MSKDILKLRNQYENIEIPLELDTIVERSFKKAKEKPRKTTWGYKTLATAAAVIMAFFITINASPAFASYVSNLGLESLVNFIRFDQGLSQGVDQGAGQVVDKSVTDNGITLTVESVVFDGRKLLVAYSLESDKHTGPLSLHEVSLTDVEGNDLLWHMTGINFGGKSFLEFSSKDLQLPNTVIIGGNSVEHTSGQDLEIISGDWTMQIDLDTDLVVETAIIELGQEITFNGQSVTLEELHIHPTVIDLKISSEISPLTYFAGSKLVDEQGNEMIATSSSTLSNGEYVINFASNYFFNTSELTLIFEPHHNIKDVPLKIDAN